MHTPRPVFDSWVEWLIDILQTPIVAWKACFVQLACRVCDSLGHSWGFHSKWGRGSGGVGALHKATAKWCTLLDQFLTVELNDLSIFCRHPLLRERLVLSNWPAEFVITWDTLGGSFPNGAEVRAGLHTATAKWCTLPNQFLTSKPAYFDSWVEWLIDILQTRPELKTTPRLASHFSFRANVPQASKCHGKLLISVVPQPFLFDRSCINI